MISPVVVFQMSCTCQLDLKPTSIVGPYRNSVQLAGLFKLCSHLRNWIISRHFCWKLKLIFQKLKFFVFFCNQLICENQWRHSKAQPQ